MILRTSSNSSSISGPDHGDQLVDTSFSSSDDSSSSDSDYTCESPAPNPVEFAPLNSDALNLIVQDLSVAKTSGSKKWEREREGAFDDFF